MSQIQYQYLNMDTRLLVPTDETLCSEVGHAGLTRAIPYFVEDVFCTLIAGGQDFTEKDAIELFKELTGIEIPEAIDKAPPPDTSESPPA